MDGLSVSLVAALRGAAMLRARLHKEIQATALPGDGREPERDISPLVFVSRGGELLKRTRQGALHWKLVSVYINSSFQVKYQHEHEHDHKTPCVCIYQHKLNFYLQVVLKMQSAHMAGTFIKTKKCKIHSKLLFFFPECCYCS
jgi:hypothetical protein